MYDNGLPCPSIRAERERIIKNKGKMVVQARVQGLAVALLLAGMTAVVTPVLAKEAASITFSLKEAELET